MQLAALGLMSGTSMDGVDVALVLTDGHAARPEPAWATTPYAPQARALLAEAVGLGAAAPADLLERAAEAVTEAHAAAVERFLAGHGIPAGTIDLVGFHGHTQWHDPAGGVTRQLGDGAALARRLGRAVVDDFRSADVAAGGQGAPFAPLYHLALARAEGLAGPLAVLNLGGVGNVTYLGAGLDEAGLIAFDTGPGNALLDDWTRRHTGAAYDRDGALAAAGRVDRARLARLLDHPYLEAAPPKSLDRNAFDPAAALAGLTAADGAATLAAFTVESVARSRAHLPAAPRRWLVTGGGRRNPVLMAGLGAALGVPVAPVEAADWNGDALEAQAFGFLAARSRLGLPLSLPGTTGVPQPLTGGRLHPAPEPVGA